MRILCLGDSIMQYNDFSTFPQTGWVQELGRFFPRNVEFLNFARNGRSSKSFIEEGRFSKILEIARAGDYALIQFGHNDEKENDLTRYTSPDANADGADNRSFRKNLEFFVNELAKAGVKSVLMTPVARRKFISENEMENTHGVYPKATVETAEKLGIPCVDMTSLTMDYFEKIGEGGSRRFFMNFDADLYENFPSGKSDNSHLRPEGANAVSKIAALEIAKIGETFPAYKELSEKAFSKAYDETSKTDKEIDDEFVVFKR